MKTKCDYKIYILSEKLNPSNVRYVGATVLTPEKRLRMHIKDSKRRDRITQKPKDKSYKAKWIRKCIRENKEIQISIIDTLDYYDENLEKYWIKKYRGLGYKLTNISDGGKAFMLGKHHSKKTKSKLRKARLGIKVSEETASKTRGGNNGFATPILQYSKDGQFIRRYNCINDAYKEFRIIAHEGGNIISHCASKNKKELYKNKNGRGKPYSSLGYVWKYENNS